MTIYLLKNFTGDDLDNRITGTGENDRIFGEAGNDYLFGGYGNDSVYGDDGNDEVIGGRGLDGIYGGAGNDTLLVGDESYWSLTDGAETLYGGDGDDEIFADLFWMNEIVIDGGSGEDSLSLSGSIVLTNTNFILGESWNVEHVALGTLYMNEAANTLSFSTDLLSVTGSYFLQEGDDFFDGGLTTGGAVYGGDGKDTLSGSGYLEGGSGKDLLIATSKNTEFSLSVNDLGIDVIQHASGENNLYLDLANKGYVFGSAEFALIADFETVVIDGVILLGDGNQTFDAGTFNLVPTYGINLEGGAGNDSLVSTAKADTLDGGTGNDTLVGGDGADVYIVDSEGDVVTEKGKSGTDVIEVTGGSLSSGDLSNIENVFILNQTLSVRLTGSDNSNYFSSSDGNNYLDGAGGMDQLYAGAGNDTLVGGGGKDFLYGGKGDDVFYFGSGDQIADTGGYDTAYVDLASLNETNFGGASDKIFEKVIYNGLGDFKFIGSESYVFATEIISGEGNDSIYSGFGADTVRSGGGNDVIKTAGQDLVDAGSGNDTITGFEKGSSGQDTLKGGAGDDVYYVYDATTLIVEAKDEGTDTVYFYEGAMTLGKNIENAITDYGNYYHEKVVLVGNGLNNYLVGGLQNDDLTGAGGNDTLIGGNGVDLLDGGSGNDNLDGGDGNDALFGGGGNNVLMGGKDSDTLEAGDGNNTLYGGSGNDVILSGAGQDLIDAGSGDDLIFYLGGADSLTGGTGYDAFAFETLSTSSATCVIDDFTSGQDIIFLDRASGQFDTMAAGGLASTAFVVGTGAKDSADRIIHDVNTGKIWFDPDGTGKATKELLCQIDAGTRLDSLDFYVF